METETHFSTRTNQCPEPIRAPLQTVQHNQMTLNTRVVIPGPFPSATHVQVLMFPQPELSQSSLQDQPQPPEHQHSCPPPAVLPGTSGAADTPI